MQKQDAGYTSCYTDLCDVVTKMIAIITMSGLGSATGLAGLSQHSFFTSIQK